MRGVSFSALFLAVLALGASSAAAAPGSLDPTFGTGGIAAADLDGNDFPAAIALQPDGKIVVAGTGSVTGDSHFTIARFNSNGLLDPTFDGDGEKTVTIATTTYNGGNDVAIQPDGGILVAGLVQLGGIYTADAVIRLTPTGALDGSFGGLGYFWGGAYSSGPIATRLKVLPDGGFLLGEYEMSGAQDVLVYRASKTGSIDGGFGTGGLARLDWGANASYLTGLDVDANGRIVVGGDYMSASNGRNDVIQMLTPGGTVEAGFAGGGRFEPQYAGEQNLADVHFAADGKIVYAFSEGGVVSVNRLTPGGSFDPTFGQGGSTTFKAGGQSTVALATAVQPDGKVIVTGRSFTPLGHAMFTTRFTAAGIADESFGPAGTQLILPSPAARNGVDIAVQPDAKILVAADETKLSNTVVRYMGDWRMPVPLSLKLNKLKSKIKAKKFKSVSGIAGGDGLAKVQVAIQRIDAKLLKKKKRCMWVKSTAGKTKNVKAVKKKCSAPGVWLAATGTTAWKFKLKKALPPGKYVIYARAVAGDGTTQSAFSKVLGNRISLTLSK